MDVDGLSVEIFTSTILILSVATGSDIIINVDDNDHASAKATSRCFISDYNSVQTYIKGVI